MKKTPGKKFSIAGFIVSLSALLSKLYVTYLAPYLINIEKEDFISKHQDEQITFDSTLSDSIIKMFGYWINVAIFVGSAFALIGFFFFIFKRVNGKKSLFALIFSIIALLICAVTKFAF